VSVGATPPGDGRWRFRVWAPFVQRVEVRIGERMHRLKRGERGYHEAILERVAPGARYAFVLDGSRELPDPASRWQPDGVTGPSALFDPSAFAWTDAGWTPPRVQDLVIYELHVGTFTHGGTLDDAIDHLDDLAALGANAVELMPVAQFPGERNWGYDGVFPYAVQHSYGGPHALQRFVDACHAHGLAVILDVVYNHIAPEGACLAEFGPYCTDRYATPWGPAMNVDGPESDEVRRYFVDSALYFLRDHHVDGLRVDAIHGIVDTSAYPFLRVLCDAVHAEHKIAIAESDLNDARVITDLGFDAMWCDDLHHAVHALIASERAGHYADFGDVADVAKALRDGFVYDGRYSVVRRRRHGNSPEGLAPHRFVVFAQNHDQVGNRPGGERLSALVDRDAARFAAAVVLLSANVPLVFMGEEYGETAPFLYFTDHADPRVIEAVRRGRETELGEGADPQDEKTFLRSKLTRTGDDELREFYRSLMALRRELPRECEVTIDGDVVTMRRGDCTITFDFAKRTFEVAKP
jgi:maltooligosyltrehalose trehalohydrolase